MADPINITLGGALPGEQIAVAFLQFQMKIYDGATLEVKAKLAQIIQEDMERWHLLWMRFLDIAGVPKAS